MDPTDPRVLQAFSATLTKEAFRGLTSRLAGGLQSVAQNPRAQAVASHLERNSHRYDLAGLGGMMALEGANLAHSAKKDPTTGKRDWNGIRHSAGEGAFLGMLAAPVAAQMLLNKGHH